MEPPTHNKLPLKRVEISLRKFNDVAIPHHLDLLTKHKENIKKYQHLEEFDRVQKEQINATRIVKQLKQLMSDMDLLRNQLVESDIQKFDKLTEISRQKSISAIEQFLALLPELQNSRPISLASSYEEYVDSSTGSSTDTGVEAVELSSDITAAYIDLNQQREYLRSFTELQNEVEEVHSLFLDFETMVQHQRESVELVEENIEITATNVDAGEKNLRMASKLNIKMYPVAGALIGGCLAGPVGMLAGLKIGGLTAIGLGLIGFTGGQMLKKKESSADFEINKKNN